MLAYRERGRRRPLVARVALALLGAALLVLAPPLVVVLPELGVPAALVALRLLAVESDRAASAYAWVDWRFARARARFARRSRPARAAILAVLLALGVLIAWWLVAELA